MNNFCRGLKASIRSAFNLEVDVFVSKKKKYVHNIFLNPLVSYPYFEELIVFIRKDLLKRTYFYPGYFIRYPKFTQSLKWRYDYILMEKRKKMGDLLDEFLKRLSIRSNKDLNITF